MPSSPDHHHSQHGAWTPWGVVSLAPRPVQPFGVQVQTAVPIAPVSELSPSETGASTVIPFLPFPIRSFAGSAAGSAGLAGFIDGHDETRRKLGNVRHSTGEIRNERR